MASKKTWIWIIVGVIGSCVIALFALAGAGVYFVSHHITSARATDRDALRAFDTERARFKDQPPLIEVDAMDRVHPARRVADIPTSPTRPETLTVLAWNPNEDRLVRVSIPFWLLRIGRRKLDVVNGDRGFDLDRLNLDVNEAERIGPALVMDARSPSGQRVLVWTQ